jgi:hypothetical protein
MMQRIMLATSAVAILVLAPVSWSQVAPETPPVLAPTRSHEHPTSAESLLAQAQELTKQISQAKAQGKDTRVAEKEQTRGEKAMQQGKEQEALRHFQAGERDLGDSPSPSD